MKNITIVITIVASLIILYALTNRALNIHFENQETMLCESAKVSQNAKYLYECACYYEGQNISCLMK